MQGSRLLVTFAAILVLLAALVVEINRQVQTSTRQAAQTASAAPVQ